MNKQQPADPPQGLLAGLNFPEGAEQQPDPMAFRFEDDDVPVDSRLHVVCATQGVVLQRCSTRQPQEQALDDILLARMVWPHHLLEESMLVQIAKYREPLSRRGAGRRRRLR